MPWLAIPWIAVAAAISAGPANAGEQSPAASPAKPSAGEAEPPGRLPAKFERLLPLHTRLAPPRPGDWLAAHKEPGQSYLVRTSR
ncbi:MAG: hypothetical protein ABSG86_01250 [Thermoguttaceae bacterium]|jgi:hypothetical protein